MKIYVNDEGYKQYLKLVTDTDKKIDNVSVDQVEGFKSSTGDGWHDNFAFEDAAREEARLCKLYSNLLKDKDKLSIINNKYNKDRVSINDTIKIKFIYQNKDTEIENIKLTGKYISDNMNETTLNSKIGKAIYNKKIGTKVSYIVNDNKITLEIIERI